MSEGTEPATVRATGGPTCENAVNAKFNFREYLFHALG
jgi:hypothetical protein